MRSGLRHNVVPEATSNHLAARNSWTFIPDSGLFFGGLPSDAEVFYFIGNIDNCEISVWNVEILKLYFCKV